MCALQPDTGEAMTRRLEAGPLLVTLGALLLLVSLFLDWFAGGATAWQAFEVWDLVLLVLGIATLWAGIGLMSPDLEVLDRRFLPAAVAAMAIIVAAQIIDPPPAVSGQDPDTGAWLALGSVIVMCAGGLLTYGRVHVSLTVEERDAPQRVSAVDARGPADPTTESHPVVEPERAGGRLFSRDKRTATEEAPADGGAPAAKAASAAAGDETSEPKQD
jgi:hypothetical protein